MRALETQVEALARRVQALEGGPPASPAGCTGVEQLKTSMTQAEVRRVLGEPLKVDATPLQTRWRYDCGSAYFDAGTRLFVGFERAR